MLSFKKVFADFWDAVYSLPREKRKRAASISGRLPWLKALPGRLPATSSKKLLIIRTDDIGDYILFRNALSIYRQSPAYKQYNITLLGNSVWKTVAETLDKNLADEFIWLDKHRYFKDESYFKSFSETLNKVGYDTLIVPTRTRYFLLEDMLALAARATHKIAVQDVFDSYRSNVEREEAGKLYNSFVRTDTEKLHEAEFNKAIAAKICGVQSGIQTPFIAQEQIPDAGDIPKPYAVLFPGAAIRSKVWPSKSFARVASYLIQERGMNVVLTGASGDTKYTEQVKAACAHAETLFDYTAKTDLIQLCGIIKNAAILVSNDTGAAHIAAALGVKTLVLSKGSNHWRFFPYPEGRNVVTFLPPAFEQDLKAGKIKEWESRAVNYDIGTIEPSRLFNYLP